MLMHDRNQITLWGPKGQINDYAQKAWSGLMSDYYLPRWELYVSTVTDAVRAGHAVDWKKYEDEIFKLERVAILFFSTTE